MNRGTPTQRAPRWPLLVALCLLAGAGRFAAAEPYLAVQTGYQCVACHVNATGGGMRTSFGDLFAQNVMAARPLPTGGSPWTGELVQNILRLGGDLRTAWSRTATPPASSQRSFSLEQLRLYTQVSVIPDRLAVYVDEQVAPGSAQNMEAYLRYGNTSDWYLKAGQFYLPFGWRLQDQTAFVREISGINMNSPDAGLELGLTRSHWEAQLDLTNGGSGNAQRGSGYEITTQVIHTASLWRLGAAGSFTQASGGNRTMGALFAGLRTGPLVWLGEADLIRQAGFPDGSHTLLPTLAELDWTLGRGQNLKLTYEFYDPQINVHNNQQTRWSIVYEYTPVPFVQARAGFRRYQGIPQNPSQNRTFAFAELHGFF
jgi:hypothetical protein